MSSLAADLTVSVQSMRHKTHQTSFRQVSHAQSTNETDPPPLANATGTWASIGPGHPSNPSSPKPSSTALKPPRSTPACPSNPSSACPCSTAQPAGCSPPSQSTDSTAYAGAKSAHYSWKVSTSKPAKISRASLTLQMEEPLQLVSKTEAPRQAAS